MTKMRTRRWGAYISALVTAAAACGNGRDSFIAANDAGGPFIATDAAAARECVNPGIRCSSDFRSIVQACDETQVVATCAPDEACADTKCLPACDAAVSQGSSVGCDFAPIAPAYFPAGSSSCFAAFIANTWNTPAHIEAEYAGEPIDITRAGRIVRTSGSETTFEPFDGELQPDDVVVLFLAQGVDPDVACPAGTEPAVPHDTSVRKTGQGASFRFKSSKPVSAYSIFPFNGSYSKTASATLLLPVPAWKPNYITMSAWETSTLTGRLPTTQIVAAEDGTDVTIVGSVPIQSGILVEGAEAGVPHTYHLNRGDLLQFVQVKDLSGSSISANKNIGLWGGHECLNIPSKQGFGDQSTRQLFPVQSWGTEYVAAPYLSRVRTGEPEPYLYKIMAAADDTALSYEPSPPHDAPTTLAKGQTALVTTFQPFVVRSQDNDHPIAMYEFMTGATFLSADNTIGDPEFTFVVPAAQYLSSYVFYVDSTYANSQLVVVRSRPQVNDFEPVTLDCAGPLEGWTPIGTSGQYEYTRFYLTRGSIPQRVAGGTCGAGRHKMESRGSFGVTVWGTDRYNSYSYPGGAAIRKLNNLGPTVN
jgi:IgGFc binding protein